MESVGIVFGEIRNFYFRFSSKKYFEGKFVTYNWSMKTETELYVVCEVVERIVKNRFLEQSEAINYYKENIDYSKDTYYIYEAIPVAAIQGGKVVRRMFPALPGQRVFAAAPDELRLAYGIADEGLKIGYFQGVSGCDILVRAKDLFHPHMFIVGRTGSGKSFFARKLMERLQEQVWVFAPTAEYNELCEGENYTLMQDVVLNYDVGQIAHYVGLNISEESILKKISLDVDRAYSAKEIGDAVAAYCKGKVNKKIDRQMEFLSDGSIGIADDGYTTEIELPRYADSLIVKLRRLQGIRFSVGRKSGDLSQGSKIFDLSAYSQFVQECIIDNFLFRLLQQERRKENGERKIIVLEEAHNYAPSTTKSVCRETIVKLAREGRKSNISICLITQRPRYIDQTVLSQSATKVLFSLSNTEDIDHITDNLAYSRENIAREIHMQRTGECIIVGDAFHGILSAQIQFDEQRTDDVD